MDDDPIDALVRGLAEAFSDTWERLGAPGSPGYFVAISVPGSEPRVFSTLEPQTLIETLRGCAQMIEDGELRAAAGPAASGPRVH